MDIEKVAVEKKRQKPGEKAAGQLLLNSAIGFRWDQLSLTANLILRDKNNRWYTLKGTGKNLCLTTGLKQA